MDIIKFGLVGDTQYTDEANGTNYDQSVTRRYRQSLRTLEAACTHFKSVGLTCSILVGDVLDGKAKDKGIVCIERVLKTVESSCHPWHFLCGNHEYYVFDRNTLFDIYVTRLRRMDTLGTISSISHCSAEILYYSSIPCPGYRFIFLDAFDVCVIPGGSSSAANEDIAWEMLGAKNPNISAESKTILGGNWFRGVSYDNQHFVPYNGAVSKAQLMWLAAQVAEAEVARETVVVFCHVPCRPASCDPSNVIWNHEEVLGVLQASPCVAAFVAGHDHGGGYDRDEKGIHHITLPAPLECAEDEVSFGVAEICRRGMGVGGAQGAGEDSSPASAANSVSVELPPAPAPAPAPIPAPPVSSIEGALPQPPTVAPEQGAAAGENFEHFLRLQWQGKVPAAVFGRLAWPADLLFEFSRY